MIVISVPGGGYQILCINPLYVTSLTAANPPGNQSTNQSMSGYESTSQSTGNQAPAAGVPMATTSPGTLTSAAAAVVATTTNREPEDIHLQIIELGAKYSQDCLEQDAHTNRITRRNSRDSVRLKRFRKPYEVPWRHSQTSFCYSSIQSEGGTTATGRGGATPEKSHGLTVDQSGSLNGNTPDKTGGIPRVGSAGSELGFLSIPTPGGPLVTRSKSLDELDFNKLRLAEAENQNLVLERQEIDSMSQNLQNLQVNE